MDLIHLDFLVLGAQKAGTTSLHDWLVQHSDIRLPLIKETHFFSHDEQFSKGRSWYASQFPVSLGGEELLGEVDPEYLYSQSAPRRIKELTDANKFIIILRSPLERAYSQYLMTVRRGFEALPFEQAVAIENQRLEGDSNNFSSDHHSYISRSLYSEQIQRYLDFFPDGEFLFVKFDDLIGGDTSQIVYESICKFIGTKHKTSDVDRTKKSNQASMPRFSWLRNVIYTKGRRSRLRKFLGSFLSDDVKLRFFVYLDRVNQRKLKKSEKVPLSRFAFNKSMLLEIIKDIDKTEALTGLDLGNWKESVSSCKT